MDNANVDNNTPIDHKREGSSMLSGEIALKDNLDEKNKKKTKTIIILTQLHCFTPKIAHLS